MTWYLGSEMKEQPLSWNRQFTFLDFSTVS